MLTITDLHPNQIQITLCIVIYIYINNEMFLIDVLTTMLWTKSALHFKLLCNFASIISIMIWQCVDII